MTEWSRSERITLERPGAELVAERVGDGPGVLLLHAGGENRRVWRPVADELARRGFRCTAYDLRGHGESEVAGADDLRIHAADVAAMLAAEPYPCTVVGASLGGLAAMLAMTDPRSVQHVASVVLLDVVPHLDADRVRTFLGELGEGHAEGPLVRDVLSPARSRQLADSSRALAELPTLLIRAGISVLSDGDCAGFADDVRHADVTTVNGARHLLARDAPAAVSALLREHLTSSAVRGRRIARLLDRTDAATIDHPGGTLRAHLDRTADLLAAWGSPDWLVDAGRLHAAYGTDGFDRTVAGLVPTAIRAAAGARTEDFVALYGRCERARSYPTLTTDAPVIVDRSTGVARRLAPAELRGFAELTAANELDVVRHSPAMASAHGAALARLFTRWTPLLSEDATAAWAHWADGS